MPEKPPGKYAAPKQPNTLSLCDYNKSFLAPLVAHLKVGQTVKLEVTGEITQINEEYGAGTENKCELGMEPKTVRQVGGARSAGTMSSQMKAAAQRKAGQDDVEDDVEDDDEDY